METNIQKWIKTVTYDEFERVCQGIDNLPCERCPAINHCGSYSKYIGWTCGKGFFRWAKDTKDIADPNEE